MNAESREILRNAHADYKAGIILLWQLADIVLSVMRAEVEARYE